MIFKWPNIYSRLRANKYEGQVAIFLGLFMRCGERLCGHWYVDVAPTLITSFSTSNIDQKMVKLSMRGGCMILSHLDAQRRRAQGDRG